MKITLQEVSLNLEHAFITARKNIKSNTSLLIEIYDVEASLTGIGECVIADFFGDTVSSVKADLERVIPFLEQWEDPFSIEKLNRVLARDLKIRNSARSAIIMAIYDLVGKKTGLPLFKLWGLSIEKDYLSSYTIGIDTPDIIRKKAEAAAQYPLLKIKLGSEKDLELLEIIKSVTNARLIVDANCGWTLTKLKDIMSTLVDLGVELIEQPFPPAAEDDYRKLKQTSKIPIFADESLKDQRDLKLIESLFHGINIKLVKCGGLYDALIMAHTAQALNLKVMIGCMIESSVAITAASHLAPLADYLDLDGNILITNDPYIGVKNISGKLKLPTDPGIGVKRREPK